MPALGPRTGQLGGVYPSEAEASPEMVARGSPTGLHPNCKSKWNMYEMGMKREEKLSAAEKRWVMEFDVRATTFNAPCVASDVQADRRTANLPFRPRQPWKYMYDNPGEGHFFCWTRPMSSGVYDRAAAAFLVHDPRAQESFWFWRRGGVAQVEHYFASTLASYYDRNELIDVAPVVMSWGRPNATSTDVRNIFLTIDDADLIAAGKSNGALYARKFDLERDGTAAVLELIDAGLPGMVGPQTEALTEEAVQPMHAVATAEDVETWYAENGVRVPMYTSDG